MVKTIERTKEGVDNLLDRTCDAVVGVTERAEIAADRATEKAHAAGAYLREGAASATRTAHERVDAAARAVESGLLNARGNVDRALTATTDRVLAHPGKALLIAAAAGLAIGLLVPRRRLPALAA